MSKKMPEKTIAHLQYMAKKRHKKKAELKVKKQIADNKRKEQIRLEAIKAKNRHVVFIPKDRKEFEEEFLKVHGMTVQEFNRGVVK